MGRAEGDTELVAPLVDCPLQKGSVGAETDVNRGRQCEDTGEAAAHSRGESLARALPSRSFGGTSPPAPWAQTVSLQPGRQRVLSSASVLCHGSRSSQLT